MYIYTYLWNHHEIKITNMFTPQISMCPSLISPYALPIPPNPQGITGLLSVTKNWFTIFRIIYIRKIIQYELVLSSFFFIAYSLIFVIFWIIALVLIVCMGRHINLPLRRRHVLQGVLRLPFTVPLEPSTVLVIQKTLSNYGRKERRDMWGGK